MEELIFIGLIIFFSILDGLARKRRAGRGQGGPLPAPDEWDRDADPDGDGIPGRPRPEYTRPYGGQTSSTPRPAPVPSEPESSEGMVPDQIWEEIAALARGERPAPPAPVPPPEPATPHAPPNRPLPRTVVRPVPRRIRDYGVGRRPEHYVHRTHAEFGTDPSSRAPTRYEGLEATLGPEARAVREMLAGDRGSLRAAVILHEVLGPPVSMRE